MRRTPRNTQHHNVWGPHENMFTVPNPLRCICRFLVPCFRLKSELAVFDRGFFEEVEDLKYSYATLKREAGRLAANQVGFLTHKNVAAILESDCHLVFGIVHTSAAKRHSRYGTSVPQPEPCCFG